MFDYDPKRHHGKVSTVNIWQNGHVTVNRGMGYARYYDHVYPSDIARIHRLLLNKKKIKKLTLAYKAQLRFYWFREARP